MDEMTKNPTQDKRSIKARVLALMVLSVFLVDSMTQSSFLLAFPVSAAPSVDIGITKPIVVPEELGTIQTINQAACFKPQAAEKNLEPASSAGRPEACNRKQVIVIQDAHAILDAQNNIRELIQYFQKQYGVRFIALEGGAGKLDPLLWRSFPDQKIKSEILENYLKRGELTGAQMAAILSSEKSNYYGIENGELYEKNYLAYLNAQKVKDAALQQITSIRTALDLERKKVYSEKLNSLHEQSEKLKAEQSSLVDFLKYAQSEIVTSDSRAEFDQKYPQLSVLMSSLDKEATASALNSDAAIRQMAEQFKKKFIHKLSKSEAMTFHGKYQEYASGQGDPAAFLKYLVSMAESVGVKPHLTSEMKALLGNHEALVAIRGTRLFEELQQFTTETENRLAVKSEEKQLIEKYKQLDWLRDLASLELTRDQFDDYQQNPEFYFSGLPKTDFEPALAFYGHALARDKALFENLNQLLEKEKTKSAIVLAGGFHSQGFEKALKEKGFSYAVVTPKISSLNGQEVYQDVMRGKISFKNYLKTSFYDAFARHSSIQMLKAADENQTGPVLKAWRDEIIRNLAEEGAIEKAADYTHYLDDLFKIQYEKTVSSGKTFSFERIQEAIQKELQNFKDQISAKLSNQFQSQVTGSLQVSSLSPELALNASPVSPALRSALLTGEMIPATPESRSEVRSETELSAGIELPSWIQRELQRKDKTVIGSGAYSVVYQPKNRSDYVIKVPFHSEEMARDEKVSVSAKRPSFQDQLVAMTQLTLLNDQGLETRYMGRHEGWFHSRKSLRRSRRTGGPAQPLLEKRDVFLQKRVSKNRILNEYLKSRPSQEETLVYRLAQRQERLWKSGYFDADLRRQNYAILTNVDTGRHRIVVLDFDLVFYLPKEKSELKNFLTTAPEGFLSPGEHFLMSLFYHPASKDPLLQKEIFRGIPNLSDISVRLQEVFETAQRKADQAEPAKFKTVFIQTLRNHPSRRVMEDLLSALAENITQARSELRSEASEINFKDAPRISLSEGVNHIVDFNSRIESLTEEDVRSENVRDELEKLLDHEKEVVVPHIARHLTNNGTALQLIYERVIQGILREGHRSMHIADVAIPITLIKLIAKNVNVSGDKVADRFKELILETFRSGAAYEQQINVYASGSHVILIDITASALKNNLPRYWRQVVNQVIKEFEGLDGKELSESDKLKHEEMLEKLRHEHYAAHAAIQIPDDDRVRTAKGQLEEPDFNQFRKRYQRQRGLTEQEIENLAMDDFRKARRASWLRRTRALLDEHQDITDSIESYAAGEAPEAMIQRQNELGLELSELLQKIVLDAVEKITERVEAIDKMAKTDRVLEQKIRELGNTEVGNFLDDDLVKKIKRRLTPRTGPDIPNPDPPAQRIEKLKILARAANLFKEGRKSVIPPGQYPNGRIVRLYHIIDELASEESPRSIHELRNDWEKVQKNEMPLEQFKTNFRRYQKTRDEALVRSYRDNRMPGMHRVKNEQGKWETKYSSAYFYKFLYRKEFTQAVLDGSFNKLIDHLSETGLSDLAETMNQHLVPMKREIGDELYWIVDAKNDEGHLEHYAAFAEYDFLKSYMAQYNSDDAMDGKIHGSLEKILEDSLADRIRKGEATFQDIREFFENMTHRIREIMPEEFQPKAKPNEELSAEGVLQRMPIFRDRETGIRYAQGPKFWYELDAMTWNIAKEANGKNKQIEALDASRLVAEQVRTSITATLTEDPFEDVGNFLNRIDEVEQINVKQKSTRGLPADQILFGKAATVSEVHQAYLQTGLLKDQTKARSELRMEKIGGILESFNASTVRSLRASNMSLVLTAYRDTPQQGRKRYYIKVIWPNPFKEKRVVSQAEQEEIENVGNKLRDREIALSDLMRKDKEIRQHTVPFLVGTLSLEKDASLILTSIMSLMSKERRRSLYGTEQPQMSDLGFLPDQEYQYIAFEEAVEGYGIPAEKYFNNFSKNITPSNSIEAMEILLDITKAVKLINQRGFYHRDLHSSEMIVPLRPGRKTGIIDFGISVRENDPEFSHETLFGLENVGKGLYTALNPGLTGFFASHHDAFRDAAAIYHMIYEIAESLPKNLDFANDLRRIADEGLGLQKDEEGGNLIISFDSKLFDVAKSSESSREDQFKFVLELYDHVIISLERIKWELEKRQVEASHIRLLGRALGLHLISKNETIKTFLDLIDYVQNDARWLIDTGRIQQESVNQAIRIANQIENVGIFGFDKENVSTNKDLYIEKLQSALTQLNAGLNIQLEEHSLLVLLTSYFAHVIRMHYAHQVYSTWLSLGDKKALLKAAGSASTVSDIVQLQFNFSKKEFEGTPFYKRSYKVVYNPLFQSFLGAQVSISQGGLLQLQRKISSENLLGALVDRNVLIIWDHQLDQYLRVEINGKKASIAVIDQDTLIGARRSELRASATETQSVKDKVVAEPEDVSRMAGLLNHVINNQANAITGLMDLAPGTGDSEKIKKEMEEFSGLMPFLAEKPVEILEEFARNFSAQSDNPFYRLVNGKKDDIFVENTASFVAGDYEAAEKIDRESLNNLLKDKGGFELIHRKINDFTKKFQGLLISLKNQVDQHDIEGMENSLGEIRNSIQPLLDFVREYENGYAQSNPIVTNERESFLALLHLLNANWWFLQGWDTLDGRHWYDYNDKLTLNFVGDTPDRDHVLNLSDAEFEEMKRIVQDIMLHRIEIGKPVQPEQQEKIEVLTDELGISVSFNRSELRKIQDEINGLNDQKISQEIIEKIKNREAFEPVLERHLESLIKQGAVSEADVEGLTNRIYGILIGAFSSVDEKVAYDAISLDSAFIEQINHKLDEVETQDPLPSLVVHLSEKSSVQEDVRNALVSSKADYQDLTILHPLKSGPSKSWRGDGGLIFTNQGYADLTDLAKKVQKLHAEKSVTPDHAVTPGFTFDQNLLADAKLNLGLDAIITQIDKLPESKRDLRRLLVRLSIKVLRLLKAEEIKNYPDAKSFVHARLEQAGLGFLADAFQFGNGNSPVANIVNLLSALKAAQEAVKQAA